MNNLYNKVYTGSYDEVDFSDVNYIRDHDLYYIDFRGIPIYFDKESFEKMKANKELDVLRTIIFNHITDHFKKMRVESFKDFYYYQPKASDILGK